MSAIVATNVDPPSVDGGSIKQRSTDMIKLGKVSVATQSAKISPVTEGALVPQRVL